MGATVVSVLVVAVVTVLALAAGLAVTVLPWYAACVLAERRGFSVQRWGGASLGCLVVAAVGALAVLKAGAPHVMLVLPAALTWAAPGALALLEPHQEVLGGQPGRHA